MSRDLVKITTGLAQKIRPGLPAILKPFGEAIKAARALGPHPTAKERAGLETWLDKLQQAALEHPEVAASCALAKVLGDSLWQGQAFDGEKALTELLHLQRHGTSRGADEKVARDGDTKAMKRLYRTRQDLLAIQFKQGPLRPPKISIDHLYMFAFGLCLGLEELTAEELAEFFDMHCWCGGKVHDPDALKKQRQRIKKILASAPGRDTMCTVPTSGEPRKTPQILFRRKHEATHREDSNH